MAKAPRIAVIGSMMTDLVTYVDRMPLAGETLAARRFEMGFGGKGANQAVAAAKLGAEVVMVGRLGDDAFGRSTLENFARLGIDARHVTITPGVPSGVAPIFVEPDGENRILIVKGANDRLTADDIDDAAADLQSCDLILLQLEIPLETVYAAIAWGRAHDRAVVLNPAPATPSLDLARICDVAFFMPNQTELAILTGLATDTVTQAEAAARTLIAGGIGRVVVTLGADGALLVEPDAQAWHVAPVRVTPVDTTGAGDAFIGSFAQRYAATGELRASLGFAAAYAADSVTRAGTQSSFATAAEARRLGDAADSRMDRKP